MRASTILLGTLGLAGALGLAGTLGLTGSPGGLSLATPASAAPKASAIQQQRIDAKGFTGVTLEGEMNVIIEQGPDTQVIARGSQDALAELDPEVEDGVLRLKEKKGLMRARLRTRTEPVTVTIRMPDLRSFSLAGSGDVTFKQVKADTLDLKIAGSGDINASGACKTLNISLAGSGDINARDFKCEAVTVKIAGSGDISTYASKDFSARIMGAGDINVYGNPVNRSRTVLGSGNITYVAGR